MATGLEKASRLLANAALRPLSGLSPRRRDRWLFGHQHGDFAGNAKFLYLYLLTHRPDIRPMWITGRADVERRLKRLDLPVCRRGTVRGARAVLRSAVHLYCHGPEDVGTALGKGALRVNLWHGVGLKAIQFGDPRSTASYYDRRDIGWLRRTHGLAARIDPHMLVTTSPFTAAHFASQFRLPIERCPPCGYPRLDCAHDAALAAKVASIDGSAVAALRREEPAEVYLYAPTFRDSERDFLADALPEPARLNAVLQDRDALLFVKLHPHTPAPDLGDFDRIRPWPGDIDLYSALAEVDALITDYSSLHYDWLFHSPRGAILYTPDAAEYRRHDRSLLYPFEDNVAGHRVGTFEALLTLIASGNALTSSPDAARVRQKFWGDLSGPASPRIIAAIEQDLNSRRDFA